MKDYSKAKIYKIVCNISGLVYVGSTCEPTLARRLAKHVGNYKIWKQNPEGTTRYMTSFKIIEGNDYDIVLIEAVQCETKDQLHARERYHIESIVCVNKVIPTRTTKEYKKMYREEHKEKIAEDSKAYYKQHKEELNKKTKEYYTKNKEELNVKMKDYREQHQEYFKQYSKEYRETNKENLKSKKSLVCTCQCGKTYTHDHKSRHERTPYHQNYLKSQNEINDDN